MLSKRPLRDSDDPEKWKKVFLDSSHLKREWEYKPKIVDPSGKERPLELRMVQIVHRHGDRTPVMLFGETEDEKKQERVFWEDLLMHNVPEYKAWIESSKDPSFDKFHWSALEKTGALKGCVLKPWPNQKHTEKDPESIMNDSRYKDIVYGQLTQIGAAQLKELGLRIRSVYGDTLGFLGGDHSSELTCSSSNFRRTIFSLQSLLEGLYPVENRKTEIPIHIRFPIDSEVMFPVKPWSIVAKGIRKAPQTQMFSFVTEDLSERMKKDWKVKHISWTHIRDIVTTNLTYNRPLLSWIDDHTVGKVFWHSCYKWNSEFSTVLGLKFAIGRFLEVLLTRACMPKVLDKSEHKKLFIYSAHDNTLFFLLRALGCDMSLEWPPYASYLIFETYADEHGNFYMRAIYNGEVVDVLDVENDTFPVDLAHVVDHKVRQGWQGAGTSRGLLTLKEFRNLFEVFIPDQYDLEFVPKKDDVYVPR
jgi:acid phosphatase